jgi:hypothetical protein
MIAATVLLAATLSADPNALWRSSVAALAAANAADTVTTYQAVGRGYRELNPLAGSPGGSVALKAGLLGAVVLTECLILRAHPKAAGKLALINFGAAGIPAAAAIHNARLK